MEILTDLQLGAFEIKLNHRKLLDAMLQIAGGWAPLGQRLGA